MALAAKVRLTPVPEPSPKLSPDPSGERAFLKLLPEVSAERLPMLPARRVFGVPVVFGVLPGRGAQ